jgi:hypothetical protein
MELSLLLMAAVHHLDLSITPQAEPANAAVGGGSRAPLLARGLSAAACALLPAAAAEWGGAALGGARARALGRATELWQHSGDPGRRLPPAELRRLVGFKVPAAGLAVDAAPVAVALGG